MENATQIPEFNKKTQMYECEQTMPMQHSVILWHLSTISHTVMKLITWWSGLDVHKLLQNDCGNDLFISTLVYSHLAASILICAGHFSSFCKEDINKLFIIGTDWCTVQ